ncbi:MAG: hypothetical protein V3V96_15505 [Acidiferrobacterales bacterium]
MKTWQIIVLQSCILAAWTASALLLWMPLAFSRPYPGTTTLTAACYDTRQEMVEALGGAMWREQRVAGGVESNGALVELFTSKNGETWSLAYTNPDQMACVFAGGEDWEYFGFPAHLIGDPS